MTALQALLRKKIDPKDTFFSQFYKLFFFQPKEAALTLASVAM